MCGNIMFLPIYLSSCIAGFLDMLLFAKGSVITLITKNTMLLYSRKTNKSLFFLTMLIHGQWLALPYSLSKRTLSFPATAEIHHTGIRKNWRHKALNAYNAPPYKWNKFLPQRSMCTEPSLPHTPPKVLLKYTNCI